jgi:hypothetical protein
MRWRRSNPDRSPLRGLTKSSVKIINLISFDFYHQPTQIDFPINNGADLADGFDGFMVHCPIINELSFPSILHHKTTRLGTIVVAMLVQKLLNSRVQLTQPVPRMSTDSGNDGKCTTRPRPVWRFTSQPGNGSLHFIHMLKYGSALYTF